MTRGGIGGHQSARIKSDDWITPQEIINALGPFDLDPCASLTQPWQTANIFYTIKDNGLIQPWKGRVWLNPPYGQETKHWIERLAYHGNGTALIFARVETKMWFEWIWNCADALFFFCGRLYFYHPNGIRAPHNSGAPSVLVAYGKENAIALDQCGLHGRYIELNNAKEEKC